jgi:preprotein translocase subunit SecB
VPEISCTANEQYDPAKPFEIDTSLFVVKVQPCRQEQPGGQTQHLWSVQMTVSQELKAGQNFPYHFKIVLFAFFSCSPDVPPDFDEERYVRINGSSILYGAAREVVRAMTSRGPWGELIVPTLSFYDANNKSAEPVAEAVK